MDYLPTSSIVEKNIFTGASKALLIHPPLYDTQYWAFWAQPHGLLKIGRWLKEHKGYTHVRLLDSLATDGKRKVSSTTIRKVQVGNILRTLRHYGWPLQKLEAELRKHARNENGLFIPEEIWITSIMTYWWESTRDVISLIRKVFVEEKVPIPKILVGGIYPTLYPEHANYFLRAETGFNEDQLLIIPGEVAREAADAYTDLSLYDDGIYTVKPRYALITGSRGCPFDCAYCAQLKLNGGNRKVRDRGPEDVAEEMFLKYKKFGIREFAFYEDNLLFNREEFIERLEAIRRKFQNVKIEIYAPEGIEPRLVEHDLMTMMYQTGFKKIHLALETIDNNIAKTWNRRQATIEKFDQAVDILKGAGFRVGSQDINAFVLFGMPGENLQAAMNTALYASTKVGSVVPMLFTPVPGSRMFKTYQDYLIENFESTVLQDKKTTLIRDLQALNGKFLPFLKYNQANYQSLRASDYLEIESLMMHLNSSKVYSKRFDFNSDSIAGRIFRKVLKETPSILSS